MFPSRGRGSWPVERLALDVGIILITLSIVLFPVVVGGSFTIFVIGTF